MKRQTAISDDRQAWIRFHTFSALLVLLVVCNVCVAEDWPTQDMLDDLGIKHRQDLYGLYQGVPLTRRGRGYNMVLPDKITIFQKPIEMRYHSDEKMVKKIQDVVRHEIAHYFGISDSRLREIGRY